MNAAKLIRIEALHSKQQAVLKRKTEEADAARKRLKVGCVNGFLNHSYVFSDKFVSS